MILCENPTSRFYDFFKNIKINSKTIYLYFFSYIFTYFYLHPVVVAIEVSWHSFPLVKNTKNTKITKNAHLIKPDKFIINLLTINYF